MDIISKVEEHKKNLDERTTPPEGKCDQCSEPWCKFNVTPSTVIDDYMTGNSKVIKNITCDSYELDETYIKG
ncbi:MAG: hypothetical protein WC806_02380 [Candidatus Gracilibacteria bacterium]|jgi:hypothetical protein